MFHNRASPKPSQVSKKKAWVPSDFLSRIEPFPALIVTPRAISAFQSDSVPPRHRLVSSWIARRPAKRPKDMDSMTKMMKFGLGEGVKRVEDIRLVSGRGAYASDAVDGAELRAVFLRSPYGHAKFRIDDIAAARAAPGVRAIYVASDFAHLGDLPCQEAVRNADGSLTPHKPYPVMASGEVHHVGDIVAMAVAETALQARDGAELIGVAWEELPAAVDMEEAIKPGAPLVFAGAPRNLAYDGFIGDKQ